MKRIIMTLVAVWMMITSMNAQRLTNIQVESAVLQRIENHGFLNCFATSHAPESSPGNANTKIESFFL